jgi:hypothetical protein
MLRALFAISVLVGGCVLPQHRGVATVANGWLFGGGFVIGAMASSDASNPNAWKDLDHAVGDVAAGLMLLGMIGEAFTLALHHDDPPASRPASLPAPSVTPSESAVCCHRAALSPPSS